jgi:hypothetical protein
MAWGAIHASDTQSLAALGLVIRRGLTANRERIDIPSGFRRRSRMPVPLMRNVWTFCEIGRPIGFVDASRGSPQWDHHNGLPRFALTSSPRIGRAAFPQDERT